VDRTGSPLEEEKEQQAEEGVVFIQRMCLIAEPAPSRKNIISLYSFKVSRDQERSINGEKAL